MPQNACSARSERQRLLVKAGPPPETTLDDVLGVGDP